MDKKNKIGGFVFVVCGSKEHLDTLKLSYDTLRKKTQYPIIIVTDLSRNEYAIDYSYIIDISTPKEFDHHQASIWLKTSLHKILPKDVLYAYLDTDILAYGKHSDGIFDQFKEPVTFAPDHCKMDQFSPYAGNCGCMDMFEKKRNEVNNIIKQYDEFSISKDPAVIGKRKLLFEAFSKSKKNGRLRIGFYFKYFLSWPHFYLSDQFKYDKRKRLWMDIQGNPLMHKINMKKVAGKAGLKWNYLKNEMTLPDGRSLWNNFCHHLQENILKKFNVEVKEKNWQHWNGGVFLFSNESEEFMNTWHNFTMEIFKDPEWKTRDQGTLIATAWKLGLQDQATLNIKWNLIMDYYNQHLEVLEDGSITVDGKTKVFPELVHIYHHWEDTSWTVWNKVINN
jgi:hypothetical protein